MPKPNNKRDKKHSASETETGSSEDAQAAFPIVGIVASAGGLNAFKSFFKHMPANSNMAFVLVPHLDPDHQSLMVELLAKQTDMPVCEVSDNMRVEPNHVYIIPPARFMTLQQGKLLLSKPPEKRVAETAIDNFLRSLGEDQAERAIGIVLSGTGSHGSVGLQAIKANGGMTMVQNPDTAEYDRMPQNAIDTGCIERRPVAFQRRYNDRR